jgi:hypothetical protein
MTDIEPDYSESELATMQAENIALKKQLAEKDAENRERREMLAEKDTRNREETEEQGCTERYNYVRSILYSTTKNNATCDSRLWSSP